MKGRPKADGVEPSRCVQELGSTSAGLLPRFAGPPAFSGLYEGKYTQAN